MISIPHGGKNAQFDEKDLISYVLKSGRDYIIQGQQECSLANHTKPNSLDYWLRVKYSSNKDTKQAVTSVINDLVKTGLFQQVDDLTCPDSGRLCKGIRLTKNSQKHNQHQTSAQSKYDTNLAAEFHVLSCLHRLGFDATLTLGNKKMVDLVVVRRSGKAARIDVKGVARKYDWPVDNIDLAGRKDHYLALLSFEGKIDDLESQPRVWIVPSTEVHHFVKSYKDDTRKVVARTLINRDGAKYLNAYDLLLKEI
jgi:hypothetical protein